MRRLITIDGEYSEPTPAQVAERAASGKGGFWLDIEAPTEADYDLLLNGLHFHPLSVEDVRERDQRPKMEQYLGYAFLVLFGATLDRDEARFREHHLFLSPDQLVTVHHEPAPDLDGLRQRLREDPSVARGKIEFMAYSVIDQIVDGIFPVLDGLDETIDALGDTIIQHAQPQTLARITTVRHTVTELRRVLSAQRDTFQRLLTHSLDTDGDLSLYWRDVYDHLVRQYEEVDSLRDLLSGSMDVYLSTVSNRLNITTKQLTVIASLFLPLTFLTGFFGMNFAVLVQSIGTSRAFALGLCTMAAATIIQLAVFWRRGWL